MQSTLQAVRCIDSWPVPPAARSDQSSGEKGLPWPTNRADPAKVDSPTAERTLLAERSES